ncbi:outer membrane beta-barrel protein [Cognatilysobacter terrigena]|uniref:outer membrane beta-barrel protein n=1 Tax=Cognatilysobacter terrigena TaxID=2488749 RepID=UPI00105C877D|nr:outer membrane beta-barrel protein [Lysobacter terrigena]
MKTTLLALALAAAPFAASAAPLSYTYIEGGYNRLHVDNDPYEDTTADGAYLRGSYDFGSSGVNVFGSVSKVSDTENFTGGRADIDLRDDQIGVGYHQPMGPRADFIAEAAWVHEVADLKETLAGVTYRDSASAHGGRASVGVRGQFNDIVEGLLKANYYDGGDFEGTWSGTVGAEFHINPTWGITAEIEHGDLIDDAATTRYQVGVRASF